MTCMHVVDFPGGAVLERPLLACFHAPRLEGTPSLDEVLTCQVDSCFEGSTALVYTYQWKVNGEDVVAATEATLTLAAGLSLEAEDAITCLVTGTNDTGACSVLSDAKAFVAA